MMRTLPLVLILGLCSGCTVVSNDRVFPKLSWAWTDEAKRQRASDRLHEQEMKEYKARKEAGQ